MMEDKPDLSTKYQVKIAMSEVNQRRVERGSRPSSAIKRKSIDVVARGTQKRQETVDVQQIQPMGELKVSKATKSNLPSLENSDNEEESKVSTNATQQVARSRTVPSSPVPKTKVQEAPKQKKPEEMSPTEIF